MKKSQFIKMLENDQEFAREVDFLVNSLCRLNPAIWDVKKEANILWQFHCATVRAKEKAGLL